MIFAREEFSEDAFLSEECVKKLKVIDGFLLDILLLSHRDSGRVTWSEIWERSESFEVTRSISTNLKIIKMQLTVMPGLYAQADVYRQTLWQLSNCERVREGECVREGELLVAETKTAFYVYCSRNKSIPSWARKPTEYTTYTCTHMSVPDHISSAHKP